MSAPAGTGRSPGSRRPSEKQKRNGCVSHLTTVLSYETSPYRFVGHRPGESVVNLVLKSAGRPRDDSRDAVILEATLDVLGEVGYDRLTIDAVAAKARASKATVYRRWPDKAALVVDAMQTLNPLAGVADGEAVRCHW